MKFFRGNFSSNDEDPPTVHIGYNIMNERLILVETGYHKALSDSFQFLLHMQKKEEILVGKI